MLGHLHLTGGQFFGHIWPSAVAALVVTALVIGVVERRSLRARPEAPAAGLQRPVLGIGLAAIVAATLAVVLLADPALPVVVIGGVAAAVRLSQRKVDVGDVRDILGVPVLAGLFGLTIGLGTLRACGRDRPTCSVTSTCGAPPRSPRSRP